jgi:hypothetical protein
VMLLAKTFIFFLTRSDLFGNTLFLSLYGFLVLLYFFFNYQWSNAQKKQHPG